MKCDYNASVENFSVVEKISYLRVFQRGCIHAHRLKTQEVSVTLQDGRHEPPRYKKMLFLGFGFFAVSLTWSLYNAFVPLLLRKFIESSAMIGFIMTLDNYLGLFLHPVMGTLSDRTRTAMGRRMPYLLFGMPVCALLVGAIPFHWNLISLLALITGYNAVMASFRSPSLALMADIAPEALRSRANGLINLLGGLGAITAYFAGSYLYRQSSVYPFYAASGFIVISVIVIYFGIREGRDSLNYDRTPSDRIYEGSSCNDDETMEQSRNLWYLLLALFFWFTAFHGVEGLFTTYAAYHLGMEEVQAAGTFTYLSLSLVVFALPAGLLSEWIGKKKTITIGLAVIIALFFWLAFLDNTKIMSALFIFAGICWALININAYPLLISITGGADTGRFSGYYYLFFCLAAIISPPFLGLLMDVFGYGIFFVYVAGGTLIALIFMLMVKCPPDGKIKVEPADEMEESPEENRENILEEAEEVPEEDGEEIHDVPEESPEEMAEEVLEETSEQVPEEDEPEKYTEEDLQLVPEEDAEEDLQEEPEAGDDFSSEEEEDDESKI